MDAFRAGRPTTFTKRVGDPLVAFDQYQFGWFLQDDFRPRKGISVSLGLRHELQSHLPDRDNLAPRVGLAWSPFPDGKTTIRAGAGIFYDWLASEVVEQTLRVDGVRQHDIVILNPGFPNPLAGGLQVALPPSRMTLEPGMRMPYLEQMSVGLERQLPKKSQLRASYFYQRGVHLLRGHNINAPMPGLGRPDPGAGNITQIESTANSALQGFTVNLSQFGSGDWQASRIVPSQPGLL